MVPAVADNQRASVRAERQALRIAKPRQAAEAVGKASGAAPCHHFPICPSRSNMSDQTFIGTPS